MSDKPGEPDQFAAIERILDDLDACNYFYRDPARIPTARLEITKARARDAELVATRNRRREQAWLGIEKELTAARDEIKAAEERLVELEGVDTEWSATNAEVIRLRKAAEEREAKVTYRTQSGGCIYVESNEQGKVIGFDDSVLKELAKAAESHQSIDGVFYVAAIAEVKVALP